MLIAKKGVYLDNLPNEVWFALGIAYQQHQLYMLDTLVVTHVDITPGKDERCNPLAYRVKLRTSDMREFDIEHWRAVLTRYLEPLGFEVEREVMHMALKFSPRADYRLLGSTE